jgi:hypothetical protein
VTKATEMIEQAVSLGNQIDPNHPVIRYWNDYLINLKSRAEADRLDNDSG